MSVAEDLRRLLEFQVAARQHLQQPPGGLAYLCIEDYVLQHGRAFLPEPLTEEERARVLEAASRCSIPFKPKLCFHNAWHLSLFGGDDDIHYVEGYVTRAGFPLALPHGWNEINGKVVDLTLRRGLKNPKPPGRLRKFGDRALGVFPDERAYFGVRIPRQYTIDFALETGTSGPMLDDWQRGWPLLRGERKVV